MIPGGEFGRKCSSMIRFYVFDLCQMQIKLFNTAVALYFNLEPAWSRESLKFCNTEFGNNFFNINYEICNKHQLISRACCKANLTILHFSFIDELIL